MPVWSSRGGARRLALVLCLLIALLPSSLAADGLARVRASGVLRWGGDLQGGEPYAFLSPDGGKLVGFEVEIAAALARRLGVRAEFVQNDWSTLLASLQRGDFDLALNGIEITEARLREWAFTRPYLAFRESLVVRRDHPSPPRTRDDLKGRRVGTLAHSLAHEILRADPAIEVVLYEGVEEPFLDLLHGRTEAVLLDHVIVGRYGLVHPELTVAAELGQGHYAAALRPSDRSLWQAVEAALGAMEESGELREILAGWGLEDGRAATAPPAAAVASSTAGTLATQAELFLRGAGVTVAVSALAMLLAVSLGLSLCVLREMGGRSWGRIVQAYIELFRGTPVLLQLYVLYYGLAPWLALDAFTAAVVGLGLNYAAYEAEVLRAGLGAVPRGQTEAALSLGMSPGQTLRHIVLPQATRVALPGVTNDFIALLKDSSLVSVITVVELTKQMTITAVDVRGWLLPGIACAALYLAMSLPLSRLARRLERRLSEGVD